jgi:hypothetical protein
MLLKTPVNVSNAIPIPTAISNPWIGAKNNINPVMI